MNITEKHLAEIRQSNISEDTKARLLLFLDMSVGNANIVSCLEDTRRDLLDDIKKQNF